jgi:hypothetical protein
MGRRAEALALVLLRDIDDGIQSKLWLKCKPPYEERTTCQSRCQLLLRRRRFCSSLGLPVGGQLRHSRRRFDLEAL